MKLTARSIFFDLTIIFISFLIVSLFKKESFELLFANYYNLLLIYSGVYIFFSLFFKKYERNKNIKTRLVIKRYILSWFVSLLSIPFIIFLFNLDISSRQMVFGLLLSVFILEMLWVGLYVAYRYAKGIKDFEEIKHKRVVQNSLINNEEIETFDNSISDENIQKIEIITKEFNEELITFFEHHISIYSSNVMYVDTNSRFSVLNKKVKSNVLVNIARLNNARRINKLIESIYTKLKNGGILICNAKTKETRKKRIFAKYPFGINFIIYTFDFIFNRVFPKVYGFKKIYFFLTKGNNRVMAFSEILGRLYSCGFELIDNTTIDGLDWFVVKKTSFPAMDYDATYGPLIKLKRVGKSGKIIEVFKFRTMHPYSEYLQQYIHERNSLALGGKFEKDFRISTIGKIFRKFWLDELPMLINLFKGELKIVGVRPLSRHYFSLYPPEMQKLRTTTKPGLVPPFYADMPKTFDEIVESEKKYILAYLKSPLKTDIKYFWMAFVNIVFKKARSK